MSILDDKNRLLYLDLRKAESLEPYRMRIGKKAVLLSPVTLREIYREFFADELLPSPLVDSVQYTLLYKNLRDWGKNHAQLEPLLLGALGYNRQVVRVKVPQYLVDIRDESRLLRSTETVYSARSDADDRIVFTNFSIAQMLRDVGKSLGLRLEYTGDNQAAYDFIIAKDSWENCEQSLEQYGLSVVLTEMEVEMVELIQP